MNQQNTQRIRKLHGSLHARCYKKSSLERNPNYIGCTVADDFYKFEDFIVNIQQVPNFEMWLYDKDFQLDKDLLIPDNKTYSKDTCVFIPKRLNIVFQGGGQKKDNSLPNGVVVGKARRYTSYIAQCTQPYKGTNRHIGTYLTVEEAFQAYCDAKQKLVALLTFDYFDKLDDFTIDALLNYVPHKEYR